MGLGAATVLPLVGLNGYVVEVEADIGQTLPAFVIPLPDAALNEAKNGSAPRHKTREFL